VVPPPKFRRRDTMKKTLIYIDEKAHRCLRYRALDEGVSMAELIRRAIRAYLKMTGRRAKR
jgi:predicted HicB family RNase H-like nuclease